MKTVIADKIASVAQNRPIKRKLQVSAEIPCEEGVLVAARILNSKSSYNTLELTSGRMAKVSRGDVIVGALGQRKALFGYSGHLPEKLSLKVGLPRVPGNARTLVKRLWLQTCVGVRSRRERAVFVVSTGEPLLAVLLPRDAVLDAVAVDGHRVDVAATETGKLAIVLDSDDAQGADDALPDRTVEVWYTLPLARSLIVGVPYAAPRIENSSGAPRVFWQLATPAKQHLLTVPHRMTSEMRWARRGVFWGRQPQMNQSQLEDWTGATHQSPLPETLNTYVFSTMDAEQNGSSYVASRFLLLLVVSGFALGIGLMLIYFPAIRHPSVLFAAGVVLLTACLMYPNLAIAGTQAAYLGLLLAASALVIKWMVDARQLDRTVVHGATYVSPDTNTVNAAALAAGGSSPGTTATASAVEKVAQESSA